MSDDVKFLFNSKSEVIPSANPLIAMRFGESAMYLNVASGCPSLIIKWTTISDLKTIVHVESRNRSCRVRNTSATPESPPFVAERIGSMYLDLGAANYLNQPRRLEKIYALYLDLCSSFNNLLHGYSFGV